jgi:hypothetical protein
MLAVVPLVSLTDRRAPARQPPRAPLAALSCFGMALCDSLLPALGFRALAGFAMAGMYMPGLRALTHGVEGATRAHIAAWYQQLDVGKGQLGSALQEGYHPPGQSAAIPSPRKYALPSSTAMRSARILACRGPGSLRP